MATRKRRDGRSGDLSSWSRAQHLKHARAIFNAAVEWGYVHRNPFSSSRAKGNSPLRIKAKSRPWHHMTPQEFLRFLEAVPTARQRACYWLMYACGLRPGEVYNLTIDRIDLDKRGVYVENREATEELPGFTIKADGQSEESRERSVPIPAAAIPDLTEAAAKAFRSGGFVALTPQRFLTVKENWRLCRAGKPWGGRKKHRPWLNRDMMNNLLRDTKRFMKRAGLELTGPLTLVTFRKSLAQNHADNGTPPRTLAKLMGHSKVETTLVYCARVTDANERAAAKTADQMFGRIAGEREVQDAG